MNSKSLSRWLTIVLPILIAGYLLWPTYQAYQLDEQRKALSDSSAIEQWDAANGESYADARSKRVKLGLDLRGGMYVTIEVDVLKMIQAAADQNSIDPEFNKVVAQTAAEVADKDVDVLDVFLKNFKATGKSLLAYFPTNGTEESDVVDKLRRDSEGAVEQAQEVIRQRVNRYGLSEVSITKQGSRRLVLELPDVKDEKEIRNLLNVQAKLEFKRVIMNADLLRGILAADRALSGVVEPQATAADTTADSTAAGSADTAAVAANDSAAKASTDTGAKKDPYAGLSEEEARRRYVADHPIGSKIFLMSQGMDQPYLVSQIDESKLQDGGEYSLFVEDRNLGALLKLLERPEVVKAMPADLQLAVAAKPMQPENEPGPKSFTVFGVAAEADLTGEVVAEAFPTYDPQSNLPAVSMQMTTEGTERWSQITGANIGKRIAIVLDGRVYTAPVVQGKIPNGNSQITGMADASEANLLAIVLKAGALKAPVRIIEERIVGPSLGEDSIRRGLQSTLISFAFIVLFMLVYYAIGGGFADLALLINLLLVVAFLTPFGFTLTLPGIAGVILSVAMAVDANILIFERMREEMAAGRTLRDAVRQGYGKAFSAIIDSNITNILSGFVLLWLGTGPIKGFAMTMIVGVLATLFTAIVVTRAMFELVIASGATTINIGQKKTA
ncbi:MAG: protein translocase subunit SecD [Candidatus Kapabacteria bacterium]|nr:protein translocase subunit SecD [Candidatus Kapabacteria bacterium]